MPADASDLQANLRWLEDKWSWARQGWRDNSAADFEANHLQPLIDESVQVGRAGDEVTAVLRSALGQVRAP